MATESRAKTGFSPSVTSCSKEPSPGPMPEHPLQITTRTPKGPDFKFELLPLHSPLLGQSRLVSFPPLIDMLKFSGYPRLIRGQSLLMGTRRAPSAGPSGWLHNAGAGDAAPMTSGRRPGRGRGGVQHRAGLEGV